MRYVTVPNEISFNFLAENNYCLTPSKLARFFPNPNIEYKTLDELITPSKQRAKIEKKSLYKYYEIGDIEVSSGFIDGNELFGYFLPSDSPLEVREDDILVSTVRTYRKGIGIVVDKSGNLVCSPACLLIRAVSSELSKEYLLAFLRSDFFVEQILAFLNRGMYPRLDKEALQNIYIPLPKSESILKYISVLQRAVINKEREIKRKHRLIHEKIKSELESNQKINQFNYEFPSLKEVEAVGRLDTARYTKAYKEFEFLISNYIHGKSNLTELGYSVSRGQNLQESAIGKSFYSDEYISGFYSLVVSSNFSEYSTLDCISYIGNKQRLKEIERGDIIFSCRGAQFGRVIMICDDVVKHITNIDNVHIRNKQAKIEQTIFIAMWLNYLRWNKHIYRVAITGSGANSLTQYQFNDINFPNFPEKTQKEIAKLYYQEGTTLTVETLTLDNFLFADNLFNESASVIELDKTSKKIKARIAEVIDLIVRNQTVSTDYAFLSY